MRAAALPAWLIIASWLTGCSCLPCLDRPFLPSGHADSWDPVLGTCGACGVCGGDCTGHTPATYLKHQLTCGSGCGEIYWGEWLSDPPDACDPCDDCGNWIGPRVCGPTMWDRVIGGWCSFWGFRSEGCSTCLPCNTCGSDCGGGCGGGKGAPLALDPGGFVVPPTKQAAPPAMEVVPSQPAPLDAESEAPALEAPPDSPPEEASSPALQLRGPTAQRSILRSTRFGT